MNFELLAGNRLSMVRSAGHHSQARAQRLRVRLFSCESVSFILLPFGGGEAPLPRNQLDFGTRAWPLACGWASALRAAGEQAQGRDGEDIELPHIEVKWQPSTGHRSRSPI